MLTLCSEILDQIIAHAEKNYPDESCGILIGEKRQPSVTEFIPCQNSYDEMHRRDPQTYPRTARTAYLIDPREQQKIFSETEKNGLEIKAIVHSHTDHDAYFSEEDKTVAAPWGEPMYPGLSYLVLSVWNGKFKEANEYYWDDTQREFVLKKRTY